MTPLLFDDAPVRNAIEVRIYKIDIYCQKLELLTYIFAVDGMDLCLLVLTQLCCKW